jgi:hypothetical protein
MADRIRIRFPKRVVSPLDVLKVSGTGQPGDPGPIVDLNPGMRLNPSNQVLRHRIGELLGTHEEMYLR